MEAGLGYNSISSAKSAISTIIALKNEMVLADHPLVQRFMKGVFNAKPPTPRYTKIWDVGKVITYLKTF